MTEIKQSDFEPDNCKSFAEAFSFFKDKDRRGHIKGCNGFIWQNEYRDYPDCSNVFCDWGRKKRGHV